MMNMRNQVSLIGNLGQDAKTTKFNSGKMVARVNIATSEIYKNSHGESVENVQWHSIVGWGKVAELMEQYFKKGNQIAVSGKLQYNSYTDKNNMERTKTEILINDFVLLNNRQKDQNKQ